MNLNIAALVACVVALAAGLRLLLRFVDRRDVSGAAVCANCGASASAMQSFECPSCHHDARAKGLVRVEGRRTASRYWLALAWTLAAIWLAAAVVSARDISRGSVVHAETQFSPSSETKVIERLHARFDGRTSSRGVLWIDLLLKAGPIRSLEVSFPTRQARSIDERGGANGHGTFSQDTFHRWLDDQGVGPDVREAETVLYDDIVAMVEQSRAGGNSGWSRGWSRGGSVSVSGAAPEPAPVVVIAMSIAWLLGMYWLLRKTNGTTPSQSPQTGAATT